MDRLRDLLRETWRMALAVSLIEVLVIAITPSPISANVYLGGYFTNSQCVDTKHVIMNCVIPPGAQIYGSNYLSGVLSVAGVKDDSISGWAYQIAVDRREDDSVYWVGNSWNHNTSPQTLYLCESYVPSSAPPAPWKAMFVRMDIERTDYCAYRCWGYEDDLDHLTYYSVRHLAMNSGEDYFRVGTSMHNEKLFKHFQFGIESVDPIDYGEAWECTEWQVGYYDHGYDAWRYEPASVAQHETSWNTWTAVNEFWIGDDNYEAVDIEYFNDDYVVWFMDEISPVENERDIWLGQGTVLASPSEPFKGGIEGYVVNSATGYPLPYSTIRLTVNINDHDVVIQEGYTDYYGRYRVVGLDPSPEHPYTVTASHLRCRDSEYSFVQSDVEFRTKNFALDPLGGPIPYKMQWM
jgi:hypothetical protein